LFSAANWGGNAFAACSGSSQAGMTAVPVKKNSNCCLPVMILPEWVSKKTVKLFIQGAVSGIIQSKHMKKLRDPSAIASCLLSVCFKNERPEPLCVKQFAGDGTVVPTKPIP
jgi:hypothetical protein